MKLGEFVARGASFLTLVANGENRATFMKLPPATGACPMEPNTGDGVGVGNRYGCGQINELSVWNLDEIY